jgi:hypothetical protein
MKRSFFALSALTLASMVPAFAVCPADPSTVLAGAWTFLAPSANATGGPAIAGRFVASARPFSPSGTLAIISTHATAATSTNAGTFTRSDNGTGSYVLNAECTGGVIFINLAWFPVQWNFDIVANATFGRTLAFRSSSAPATPPVTSQPACTGTYNPYLPAPYLCSPALNLPPFLNSGVGTAWPAPSGCPAGLANSVDLLTGTYNFSLGGVGTGQLTVGAPLLPVWLNRGSLTASLLSVPPATIQPPPAPYYSAVNAGQYYVESDCLRGTMNLNFSLPRPFQYDFFTRVNAAGDFSYVLIDTFAGVLATSAAPTPATIYAVSTGTVSR